MKCECAKNIKFYSSGNSQISASIDPFTSAYLDGSSFISIDSELNHPIPYFTSEGSSSSSINITKEVELDLEGDSEMVVQCGLYSIDCAVISDEDADAVSRQDGVWVRIQPDQREHPRTVLQNIEARSTDWYEYSTDNMSRGLTYLVHQMLINRNCTFTLFYNYTQGARGLRTGYPLVIDYCDILKIQYYYFKNFGLKNKYYR